MITFSGISDWWHKNIAIKTYRKIIDPIQSRAEDLAYYIYKNEWKADAVIDFNTYEYSYNVRKKFDGFYTKALMRYEANIDDPYSVVHRFTKKLYDLFKLNRVDDIAKYSYVLFNLDLRSRWGKESRFIHGYELATYLTLFDEDNPEMFVEVLYLYALYNDSITHEGCCF